MNILRLELNYFRNYLAQKAELSPGINIFSGDNAQGKTNLLEAVYFMSLGKSMRTPRDKELIMWGHTRGRVKAEINKRAGVGTVEIVLDCAVNKRVAVNGMPITRIGELMGALTTVLFSPDEIAIIKDTPQKRRKFMDIALCQLSKAYFYCLSDYNKILAQRNKLLKRHAPVSAVEVWDVQLIENCAKIVRTRREFVRRLEKYAAESHSFLTDGKEKLSISYEGTEGETRQEIKDNFTEKLKAGLEADYKHGFTHCGPQTDDLAVMLDGVDVYIPGGPIRAKSGSVIGVEASDFVRSFTIDKCFCGVSAVNLSKGICHPNYEEIDGNKAMVAASRQCYIVSDSSKMNQNAPFKMIDLSDVDGFVVDAHFPKEYQEYTFKGGGAGV